MKHGMSGRLSITGPKFQNGWRLWKIQVYNIAKELEMAGYSETSESTVTESHVVREKKLSVTTTGPFFGQSNSLDV